jgi:hypothetical protein
MCLQKKKQVLADECSLKVKRDLMYTSKRDLIYTQKRPTHYKHARDCSTTHTHATRSTSHPMLVGHIVSFLYIFCHSYAWVFEY